MQQGRLEINQAKIRVPPKWTNDFGRWLAQKIDTERNEDVFLWAECSRIQKDCKKVEKNEKKLLTFLWDNDKIHKLTRAGTRRSEH